MGIAEAEQRTYQMHFTDKVLFLNHYGPPQGAFYWPLINPLEESVLPKGTTTDQDGVEFEPPYFHSSHSCFWATVAWLKVQTFRRLQSLKLFSQTLTQPCGTFTWRHLECLLTGDKRRGEYKCAAVVLFRRPIWGVSHVEEYSWTHECRNQDGKSRDNVILT